MEKAQIKRCAVYTRKSTGKGLEQEFNSLDAQRESAENFIKSQKHNGWQLLPAHYDDGGYSGGTTERPALKRLMEDIMAGGIDVIVVYKLDRLSRSLLDFMNMAEFFEQHNVSFISVTQDINTSTSSGRMMLNILMTFCQFEREILVERIKDKIAGAKRRGKHCGGSPVLGYDSDKKTKKLIINHKEARIVREMFDIYTKLGSARETARVLSQKGYHSKEWTTRKGELHRGKTIKPDMVYRMLNNPIYLGKVSHKGKLYAGEQEAIISKKQWDVVQQVLKSNLNSNGKSRQRMAAPFKGLLKCGYCGGAMGMTYSVKEDRRYVYYLCQKDAKRIDSQCPLVRIPGGDVDKAVLKQLGRIFRTPELLAQCAQAVSVQNDETKQILQKREKELQQQLQNNRKTMLETVNDSAKLKELSNQHLEIQAEFTEIQQRIKDVKNKITGKEIVGAFHSIDALWEELFPAERYRLAHLLIDRITLFKDQIVIDVKTNGMKSLAKEFQTDGSVESTGSEPEIVRLSVPVRITSRDNRRIVILPDDNGQPTQAYPVNQTLVQALAKAHTWFEMLERGEAGSILQLADMLNQDRTYVGRMLNLVNLSPEIQTAILKGEEPDGLTLKKLRNDLPVDWQEQKEMFEICSIS
jgi:site-specific DNA recombinase